jgi:hypothetical protein
VFTERRSVGLDVHARSVAAAAIDGVTGELFQSRANTGCEDGSRTGMTVARSHRVCIRDIGFDVDVGGLAVVEAPVLGRRSAGESAVKSASSASFPVWHRALGLARGSARTSAPPPPG